MALHVVCLATSYLNLFHVILAAVDSRVASVVGHDASGGKYGIAANTLTYLKFDTTLKNWVSVPKASFTPLSSKMQKLAANAPGGDPTATVSVAGDAWGGKIISISALKGLP